MQRPVLAWPHAALVVCATSASLNTRSPWFLAGGIAAHGVLWDLWHHHQATLVPDWYVIGCLLVDVALAYVALEVPNLRRSTTLARRARSETRRPASAP